ncbi:MFS transporter [Cupriavidus sp. 2TAF22]|uniref:MFS transporter n=1 Tax=unclassified Cupriavidus TaxID=2640874 RepID=UPI003F8DAB13
MASNSTGAVSSATSTEVLSGSDARKAVIGASLGTVFEWYDFFVYGLVATIIAKQFFAGLDSTSAFILALLGFGAGFIVRPLGAAVFGRLGDMIGRKYTFLITIVLMGVATFATGLLPTYNQVGILSPVLLIALRMLQGLAIGGEYGGAAIYVCEHAPANKRGMFTSWIQTTGTAGMLLSLVVVISVSYATGDQYEQWGWRVPFLLSLPLLLVSLYIRLSLHESPVFKKMKAEGTRSKAPLSEAFGQWKNLRAVLIALFGVCAGQTVIYFTCQFFPLFFLTQTLKVDAKTANMLVMFALVFGCPLFVVFGSLSDKIGRKPILVTGLLLAAVTFFPIYRGLTHFANPALERAQQSAPIVVQADPQECSFQFNPTGTKKFTSSCDVAKQVLAQNAASYETLPAASGTVALVKIGSLEIPSYDASRLAPAELKEAEKKFKAAVLDGMTKAQYPHAAAPEDINKAAVFALLAVLMIYAAMTYSVVGAILVELFPARIRYSSFSVPYHIATGWFGGLQPTVSFALIAQFGNIYFGLWYPTMVVAVSLVVAVLFLRETRHVDIHA